MAERRIGAMGARIWSAVACGKGGPPQVRRRSLWMTPCGWPVRWLQAPTRPLSSFRSAAGAWRLTAGAAGGALGACENSEAFGVAGAGTGAEAEAAAAAAGVGAEAGAEAEAGAVAARERAA